MEIRRVGENKIRCALTEGEIREMGFEIEEIIANSETTQKFMRVVLSMLEEQGNINLENVSPMVRAELLQDHSMAITFGGDIDLTFKSLMDTVGQLMSQLDPEELEEMFGIGREDGKGADRFLAGLAAALNRARGEEEEAEGQDRREEPMVCALRFSSMDQMIDMSRVCFPDKLPHSSLYRFEGSYYLVLDFTEFTKEELRPFAFGTMEYDDGHFSEDSQIAHIREMGQCIVKNEALQMLMQL